MEINKTLKKNIKRIQSKLDNFQQKRQELLKKHSFKSSKEINSKRKRKIYNSYGKVMDSCRYRLRNAADNFTQIFSKHFGEK